MRLTRSSRFFIALLTAVLLLVCQTAYAVNACAQAGKPAEAVAATLPCHPPGPEGAEPASNAPGVAAACAVSAALPDQAKVPVFASADLRVALVGDAFAQTAAVPAIAALHRHVACASPPLTILHCRFLN